GSITPTGNVAVNCAANKSFTIAPSPAHHVTGVLVDGVPRGAITSYAFTNVSANHTIAASFAIDTYTITSSAGANGTISPNGAVVVNSGDSQSYAMTADSCYHVEDVVVDGVSR